MEQNNRPLWCEKFWINEQAVVINTYCRIRICMDIDVFLCWKSLTFHQWTINIWSLVDAHAHYLQGKNKPWKLQGNDGIAWIMLGNGMWHHPA